MKPRMTRRNLRRTQNSRTLADLISAYRIRTTRTKRELAAIRMLEAAKRKDHFKRREAIAWLADHHDRTLDAA